MSEHGHGEGHGGHEHAGHRSEGLVDSAAEVFGELKPQKMVEETAQIFKSLFQGGHKSSGGGKHH